METIMEKELKPFPEVILWNQEPAGKISFINEGDFHKNDLLRTLGLEESSLTGSFGVTEREEILRRQRLLKFFMENRTAQGFLKSMNFDDMAIPLDGQEFPGLFQSA